MRGERHRVMTPRVIIQLLIVIVVIPFLPLLDGYGESAGTMRANSKV